VESAKRYEPEEINLSDPRVVYTIEINFIGRNKRVLEVGCSTGYFTKILRDRGNEVYCIEIDPEAAKIAERHCNKIIVGDVEQINFDDYFEPEFFDVVLFGDVLEHLKDPESVLKKVKKFLKKEGYIVASIPNIAHGDVILSLMLGRFDYCPLGLLDKTHLRFFTLKSIREMFKRSGFKITELSTTKVEVGYTELGDVVKQVPEPIVRLIRKLPHSNVYQYVVKAHHEEFDAPEIEIKDFDIQNVHDEILELSDKVRKLSQELMTKEEQIRKLSEDLLKASLELDSIKSSFTWRSLMKWHSFVEKVAPPGTRRRHYYDFGIKALRILANEGLRALYQKYKLYKQSKKQICRIEVGEVRVTKEDIDQEKITINKKVSIIIPTKNAGSDFEYTLEKIKNQKGIKEIEIICVDSGSTDDTIAIAEKFGTKVFKIKPEEFNHGETRNYGAEKASGDYLVFTVQDAIPISEYWLYNMIKILEENPDVAAVTCRQIPRNDADLFACWSMWYHYKVLDFNTDKIVAPPPDFDKLPPLEKRKLCGLDDVSTAVRRDVFSKFKFRRLPFAEDLDLGIRLMKSNYKLAFLYSTGVIHSHVRDAYYHLKRSYVDRIALEDILGDKSKHYPKCNTDEVISSLVVLYCSLNMAIEHIVNNPAYRHDNELIISKIKDYMQENVYKIEISDLENKLRETNFEKSLSEFFNQLYMLNDTPNVNKKIIFTFLTGFFSSLDSLRECPTTKYAELNEVVASVYKIFSIHVGSLLAEKIRELKNDERLEEIRKFVEGGV